MASTCNYAREQSKLDLRQEQYMNNEVLWRPVLNRFNKALRDVCTEGSALAVERHQMRGQLLRKFPPSIEPYQLYTCPEN